jgi:ribosomal protein S18 acetylase RimI-like enzyme
MAEILELRSRSAISSSVIKATTARSHSHVWMWTDLPTIDAFVNHADNGLVPHADDYVIRDYTDDDEPSWLRCRVLSFLATAYFDDVIARKPAVGASGFELVAVNNSQTVVGLMDIVMEGAVGAIDTLAVHPDYQHRGIARALLAQAITRGQARCLTMLSAWTRDDGAALNWYRTMGFIETDRYLHVFANHNADPAEPGRAVHAMRPGLQLISGFFHAEIDEGRELREQFTRVHVCRRFARAL